MEASSAHSQTFTFTMSRNRTKCSILCQLLMLCFTFKRNSGLKMYSPALRLQLHPAQDKMRKKDKLINKKQLPFMSEQKWVCNAKGGWAPFPPLKSQRNYAIVKLGTRVWHVFK